MGNQKLFCSLSEQTETRLHFMKMRCTSVCNLKYAVRPSVSSEIFFQVMALKKCLLPLSWDVSFYGMNIIRLQAVWRKRRAFSSIYPRETICYHSWLFDRKISSYQFLLSLSFSEENLWCCYGESKAVPLLSILSCFCLIKLYSTFLCISFWVSLAFFLC